MNIESPAVRRDPGARLRTPDRPPFEDGTELLGSAPRSAADYRTAAARTQALLTTTTTPRLKQYLGEIIAWCEGQAVDLEHKRQRQRRSALGSAEQEIQ
jgi:hypothetical protein